MQHTGTSFSRSSNLVVRIDFQFVLRFHLVALPKQICGLRLLGNPWSPWASIQANLRVCEDLDEMPTTVVIPGRLNPGPWREAMLLLYQVALYSLLLASSGCQLLLESYYYSYYCTTDTSYYPSRSSRALNANKLSTPKFDDVCTSCDGHESVCCKKLSLATNYFFIL